MAPIKYLEEENKAIPMKLFHTIEEERILFNLLYEAIITLLPRADRNARQKRKVQGRIPHKHRHKDPSQNVSITASL